MPTLITSPSNVNTKVRFQEQYVSAGLNQKTVGAIPNGIIRGGNLVTTGAGLNVQIEPDPDSGDSVYTYTTPTGFQLTHRESGIRVLDLTPVAGAPVYICLFIQYAIGSTTVVEWRTYSEAELFTAPVAEAGSVVIVGFVDVPGAGPVPAANVTRDRVRYAWKDQATGMLPTGYSAAPLINSIPGYYGEEIVSASVRVDHSPPTLVPPRSGQFVLQVQLTGTSGIGRIGPGQFNVADVWSSGLMPVEEGQLIDVSFWLAGDSVDAYTAGTNGCRLIIDFFDETGSIISTVQVASDPATHIGSFGFDRLTAIFAAPANCFLRWYLEMSIDQGGGLGYFYVDDVDIFLQPRVASETREAAFVKPAMRASVLDLQPSGAAIGDTNVLNYKVARFVAEDMGGALTGLRVMRGNDPQLLRWLTPIISQDTDIVDNSYGILGTVVGPTDDTVPTTYKLLHRYKASTGSVRIYSSAIGEYCIASNARWDAGSSVWVGDDTGRDAAAYCFNEDRLTIKRKNSVLPANWSDAAWDQSQGAFVDSNGDISYTGPITRVRYYDLNTIASNNNSVLDGVGSNEWILSGIGSTLALTIGGSTHHIEFPLLGIVPDGSSLIDLQVGYQASGGSFVNPIALILRRTAPDEVTLPLNILAGQTTTVASYSQSPAQPFDDHIQLSVGGGLPVVIDHESYNYQLFLEGFLQGGGSAVVSYAKITYQDPGPAGR